jgi:NADH-quinone oxidoreductase subunit J
MSLNLILFLFMAMVAVLTAVLMLINRSAVYAALFLILNFSTVALLYLVLGAPFIAFSQVTVYAGAIMILFLFVIMLLGAEKLPAGENLRWQRPAVMVLTAIILIEAAVVLIAKGGAQPSLPVPAANFGSPADVGMALFSQYTLPFEVTSIILLVALIGAIVLTRKEKRG